MQYSMTRMDDLTVMTILINGKPYVATSDHPLWQDILDKSLANDESVADIFEAGAIVKSEFQRLSDRISVRGGRVKFDNDDLDLDISDKILEMVRSEKDLSPLTKFLDKMMQNPSVQSRSQAIRFLGHYSWGLTEDGDVLAYKGVNRVEKADKHSYRSVHRGSSEVIVDDELYIGGHVYQSPGSVVEMSRSAVDDNFNAACSTGLHVSNWSHASGYGDAILLVKFHPRDMVSVPKDENWVKIRVCRYEVVREVSEPVDWIITLPKMEKPYLNDTPAPAPYVNNTSTTTAATNALGYSAYSPPVSVGTDEDDDDDLYWDECSICGEPNCFEECEDDY